MPRIDPGSIWLADLEPRRGTEPGKLRPVLVVQGDALLDAGHPSTLIVPLTTNLIDDAEPLRIRVTAFGRLRKDSDLLIDQLRAIDNRRLRGRPLGRLSGEQLREVRTAIADILDIEAPDLAGSERQGR
jgi:mRNA interferase MazF